MSQHQADFAEGYSVGRAHERELVNCLAEALQHIEIVCWADDMNSKARLDAIDQLSERAIAAYKESQDMGEAAPNGVHSREDDRQKTCPSPTREQLVELVAELMANGWNYGTHPRDKAEIVITALSPFVKWGG